MKSDAVHSGMNELSKFLSIGFIFSIVGYLARLLLEHYQQKNLEDHKRGHQIELEGYKNTLLCWRTGLTFFIRNAGSPLSRWCEQSRPPRGTSIC